MAVDLLHVGVNALGDGVGHQMGNVTPERRADAGEGVVGSVDNGVIAADSGQEVLHHRLIDMGLNQKQAVATLYVISGILGLSAVVLTTGGEAKAMLLLIALCVVAVVAARVVFPKEVKEELHEELEELTELGHHEEKDKQKEDGSHE